MEISPKIIGQVIVWAQKQEKLKEIDAQTLTLKFLAESECRLGRLPANCCIVQNTSLKNV